MTKKSQTSCAIVYASIVKTKCCVKRKKEFICRCAYSNRHDDFECIVGMYSECRASTIGDQRYALKSSKKKKRRKNECENLMAEF